MTPKKPALLRQKIKGSQSADSLLVCSNLYYFFYTWLTFFKRENLHKCRLFKCENHPKPDGVVRTTRKTREREGSCIGPSASSATPKKQIGRASCRERV